MQVSLHNLAEVNPSIVNGEVVTSYKKLHHNDVFVVGDRKFRIEFSKPFGCDYDTNLPCSHAFFCTMFLFVSVQRALRATGCVVNAIFAPFERV